MIFVITCGACLAIVYLGGLAAVRYNAPYIAALAALAAMAVVVVSTVWVTL